MTYDGKELNSGPRFSGVWRYYLFGFIPINGTVHETGWRRRRGPHVWRYLGVWRDVG